MVDRSAALLRAQPDFERQMVGRARQAPVAAQQISSAALPQPEPEVNISTICQLPLRSVS
jgi:hypothetical protein